MLSPYRVPLMVLYVTVGQLAIGTCVVRLIHAQPRPISVDAQVERISARQLDMSTRITNLEQQNLPTRVALVERAQIDQRDAAKEIRQLLYGVLMAVAGSIFAHILQLRVSLGKS